MVQKIKLLTWSSESALLGSAHDFLPVFLLLLETLLEDTIVDGVQLDSRVPHNVISCLKSHPLHNFLEFGEMTKVKGCHIGRILTLTKDRNVESDANNERVLCRDKVAHFLLQTASVVFVAPHHWSSWNSGSVPS